MTPEPPDDLSVFKYELPALGQKWLELPRGAQILRVDSQFGVLQVWALVKQDAPLEKRAFSVVHTGSLVVPPGAVYIDTVLTDGGSYVRHIFEITECLP